VELEKVRRTPGGNRHHFIACYPGEGFPALSITGGSCELRCARCGGRYLSGMIDCREPERLHEICLELASRGAFGVLVSGGCNSEGYVPLETHLDAIQRVKDETNLFVAVHTGLLPAWLARELGRAGVDLADFEIFGDGGTIPLATGLDRTPEDYLDSMRWLLRSVPRVVPHICVGAHRGRVVGELMAVEMLSGLDGVRELVFIVFTPTPGTSIGGAPPPEPGEVGKVIYEARRIFSGEIALGCMRPRGRLREEYEMAALLSGVDRMEMPSPATVSAAREMGLRIGRMNACCSVPLDARGWLEWSDA
jgi:uncharacterized radical SAM superfamily protein